MKKKILVIAPHADDEILGCGGTINKFRSDYSVNVLVMTNANKGNPKKYPDVKIKKIREESIRASKILKIKKIFFENFPAPNLDQFPIALIAEALNKQIKLLKPDMVFIPDKTDLHHDHKIIYQASLVATRPLDNKFIKYLISYETLSETEWETERFNPNLFISLSENDIKKKIKAFKEYKSQIKNAYHPRSKEGIINLAKYRGQFINSKYAEAFKIIKAVY